MSEILTNLSKVLPQLAIIAAVFGFLGWWLRGSSAKPQPVKAGKPASEKAPQDRSKNLESTLEKSKTAQKALKAELDALKAASVSKEFHEQALAGLETAQASLASESKRTAALDTELRKVQENLRILNSRSNDASKAQKDRSFALENELSKARQELAVLHERPDDSSNLQLEIERLRESVATSTRFAGELRKREAVAIEALERAQAQLANLGESARTVAPRKIGPVGDSDRVAAAKAEVLRLVEQNKQKPAEWVPAFENPAPALAVAGVAVLQTIAPVAEETVSAPDQPAPAIGTPAPLGELESAPAAETTATEETEPSATRHEDELSDPKPAQVGSGHFAID